MNYVNQLNGSLTKLERGNTTIEKAMQSPTLKSIVTQIGQENSVIIISSLLNEASVLSGSNIDKEDIPIIAYTLINECLNVCFDRIIYSIRNGLNGKYGKFYKVTYTVIIGWIDNSEKEWIEYLDRRHESNKKLSFELPETILPILKDVAVKLDINKEKPKAHIVRGRTEQEKIIDEWTKEFEKLFEEVGVIEKGIRFVCDMTLGEFLENKLQKFTEDEHK